MNLPIFILCFVFIITITVLLVIVLVYIRNTNKALASNGMRCNSDWLCGGDINNLTDAESPVLDYIPMLYACRVDNFVPKDFSGIPGSNDECVCPIQFVDDYNIDTSISSNKFGTLIPKNPSNIKSTYYTCDNSNNNNPALLATTAADANGTIATCPADVCKAYWTSRPGVFTTTGTNPKMTDVTTYPQDDVLWPVKGYTGNVKNSRPPGLIPVGYPQLNPPGPPSVITSMPTFRASNILKQLNV